jgi:ASPM-SPD-2-Hydin domain-containing protein/galactose oxidase-like protein
MLSKLQTCNTQASPRSGRKDAFLSRTRLLHVLRKLGFLLAAAAALSGYAFAQSGSFVPTGNLSDGSYGQASTLLSNGKVLVVGGVDSVNNAVPPQLFDPTTGAFSAAGTMNVTRESSTATLLMNGKVLIAGGDANGTAELYDPASNTFTPTGSMTKVRFGQYATTLNNGNVLIVGGASCPHACGDQSAELYDPATGMFTATGSLQEGITSYTLTSLPDGKALVAGGCIPLLPACAADAELYDPSTGTFSFTGHLIVAHFRHTATLLNDGKVLIAGGSGNSGVQTEAELYDPATGTFAPTGSMNIARTSATATLLNDGTVLLAGGDTEGTSPYPTQAEIYDPTSGTFALTGSLSAGRINHSASLLSNGIVLIAGGSFFTSGTNIQLISLDSAELYEPVTLDPASITFPDQSNGFTSAAQTVTLTNHSSTALSISGVSLTGANSSDFAQTSNCVGSVPAGMSCSLQITFTPTATGARNAVLQIASNLSVNPVLVPLTGTGVAPAPVVSLSPNGVAFATQALGTTSAPQTVTLRNTGTATLNIQTIAITGANAGDFAITNGSTCTSGANVAINGSCTIQFTFTPTGPGARSAIVSIADNAADSPETISLSGTTAPSVSIAPSTVTFSSQYVGTSGLPQTVTVTNTGTASVTVTAVTASPSDFGVLSNCTNVVAAGANCTIGVFFDPTAGGTRTGTLSITDNAAGSPQTITLTASGEDFSMTPGSASSATVTPGQSASYSIAIAPAGGFAQTVALSCSGGPAQSTCTVSPNSIALGGKSATTAMVTVTTMASAQGPVLPRGTGWPMQHRQTPLILALIWMSLLMAALLSLSRREQRFRWAPQFALAVLVCLGMTLTSCGGGSGGGGGSSPQAGTYTVTVTGNFSSGSTTLTHAAKVTLIVQ